MPKVFISTSPFGEIDSKTVKFFKETGREIGGLSIHSELHIIEGIFILEKK
jgi:hypothetical protein